MGWPTSGKVKRRSFGLIIANRRTLRAPERWYTQSAKNVAANGTCMFLNCSHRATDIGRTTREYAKGYLNYM